MCGDFNTVVDPFIDRVGCNPSSLWAYNWPISLANLTKEMDLQDIWRLRHPADRCYTWSSASGSQASRLDMFWLSSSLIDSVINIGIYPYFRSDHSYVFLKFSLPSTPERGPGLWKFNSSLLRDPHFTAQVTTFWHERQLEKSTFPNLAIWWDAGKKRLKLIIRQYSRQQTSLIFFVKNNPVGCVVCSVVSGMHKVSLFVLYRPFFMFGVFIMFICLLLPVCPNRVKIFSSILWTLSSPLPSLPCAKVMFSMQSVWLL